MQINRLAALVTGGGSGLGAATARLLAERGAKVAILDVNMDQARDVAAEIGGIALECDVSSEEQDEAAVNAARDAHGPAQNFGLLRRHR